MRFAHLEHRIELRTLYVGPKALLLADPIAEPTKVIVQLYFCLRKWKEFSNQEAQAFAMDLCNCVEPQWSPDDILLKYQYIADFFIALAYFSIPLELVYFVKKSAVFPYKWVLTQFGAFIVLCGATHFINLWTFTVHSRNVAVVMAVAKVLTALVSCATALMLVHIIPDLLTVKTRELFLKTKAAELDREMGLIRTQEQTGRHVRMLTQEIRSTLDRRTILNTTLIELGKTLALEECALYMPTCNGLELQLSHTLHQQYPGPLTLPIHNPTIKKIFNSQRAMIIHPDTIVMTTPPRNGHRVPGDVVAAMRVPLLHYTNLRIADWPDPSKRPYALMVLMLPPASARRWHAHELELVEVVAEQVAVALSHAAILEESLRARNLLLEQNIALDVARREAETAISARNKFLAVMNHEIHTPMNAILTYASMLQATVLTLEQRSMLEMVVKSANLLSLLVHDVFDLSRLDDGSFKLDSNKFNLCNLFQEVMDLVKPIASLKKLSLHLDLAPDLPEFALGDDKRLMHITLNIIGNAVKYTREGSITIMACLERREYLRDSHCPDFHPVEDDKNFFLRVQVRDTGFGIDPSDMPMVFNKFKSSPSKKNNDGTGLGLAICKRFVNLMDGHIWIESEGLGRGSTVTFIVKLQVPPRCVEEMQQVLPAWTTLDQTHFSHVKALLIDHDMSNGLLIKDLLKHLAVDVTAVCSGYEGLQVLSQFGRMFKIVFVDICMLDVDGCSLGVHVKKMFATQAERPLVIALTENTHLATRVRCFSLCVDGILLKPVSLEKVKSLLFKLLNQGSRF